MNGEVDFAGEQRVLDFLDEETQAAYTEAVNRLFRLQDEDTSEPSKRT